MISAGEFAARGVERFESGVAIFYGTTQHPKVV